MLAIEMDLVETLSLMKKSIYFQQKKPQKMVLKII
jgi:hypothetical protein